jgi:HEAT repeat protein
MASSPRWDVRIEALEALSDCALELDLERLVRKRIHDRSELVHVTAIEMCGDHAMKSVQPDIAQRLTSDRSWLVRRAAAIALAEMSAVGVRKVLADRVRNADEEERVGLYYALVRLGGRRYMAPLIQGLKHDFYRIRCATANVIPGVANETNKRSLIRLLKDALNREKSLAARGSIERALSELTGG